MAPAARARAVKAETSNAKDALGATAPPSPSPGEVPVWARWPSHGGSKVEAEVGGIVAHGRPAPKADAVRHVRIAENGAGTDAMRGKAGQQHPAQGLPRLAKAVNGDATYFEHPGFKPIRSVP